MKLYLHSMRGRAGGRDGEKNESAFKSHGRERAALAEGINLGRGVPWMGWGRGGRRRKRKRVCWKMDGNCPAGSRGHRDTAEVSCGV